jgi:hypothetical protein
MRGRPGRAGHATDLDGAECEPGVIISEHVAHERGTRVSPNGTPIALIAITNTHSLSVFLNNTAQTSGAPPITIQNTPKHLTRVDPHFAIIISPRADNAIEKIQFTTENQVPQEDAPSGSPRPYRRHIDDPAETTSIPS